MAEELTAATFEPALGGTFQVRACEGGQGPGPSLELVQMDVVPDTDGRSFALVFRGEASVPLSQGTYTFDNATVGEVTIFIVPIGPGTDGAPRYEAVFCRN